MALRLEFDAYGEHLYAEPSADVSYMAWDAMYDMHSRKWCKEVLFAELIEELPGPLYLFNIKFVPRGIPEDETFWITGALGSEQVSLEMPGDDKNVAHEILLRYLGLFLIFAYGNRYTKIPLDMYWAISGEKIKDDRESRQKIINVTRRSLTSCGYVALGDFMPILQLFGDDPYKEELLLDSAYYEQEITTESISEWINWPDQPASEREPVVKRSRRYTIGS